MWNDEDVYMPEYEDNRELESIPTRVWVALEVLNAGRCAEQITSLAFDVIAKYLKEDSNV